MACPCGHIPVFFSLPQVEGKKYATNILWINRKWNAWGSLQTHFGYRTLKISGGSRMTHCPPSADPIDAIYDRYRDAQVLFTGNRLGVFSTLAHKTMTADELAVAIQASPRGTRILCDALVSLELLEKNGTAYRNSAVALQYLTDDAPSPRSAILRHSARLYERWAGLPHAVKTGQPVLETWISPELREDEREHALAMADVGRTSAQETAEHLDLTDVKSLIDIGCGPGLYSIEFARRNPPLHATLFDNEKTLEIARHNVEQAGLEERIHYQVGDILTDEIRGKFDFVFISNLIHSFSFDQNAAMVRKCAASLKSCGRICIKDFLLNPDRSGPKWQALFAVNMLVNTEYGDCYTLEEIQQWFRDADMDFVEDIEIGNHSCMVIGQKK